jgi:hypothetical protein
MNSKVANDSSQEYEVVWSAPAWQFGLIILGTVAVMLVVAGALLVQQFPALAKPPVWAGAAVILLILAFACRAFVFPRLQLQIGRDRFRIVESFGKVSDEIPYAAIADIKVVRQASVEEASGTSSGGLGLSSFLKGMRAPDAGSKVNERRYLGIRFQDEDLEKLPEEDRARHARIRGTFQGCDWVLGSDLFQRSLATIAQKIHVRWVAYLKRTGGGTNTVTTRPGATSNAGATQGVPSNGAPSNGAANDAARNAAASHGATSNGTATNGAAPSAADVSARSCRLTASLEA